MKGSTVPFWVGPPLPPVPHLQIEISFPIKLGILKTAHGTILTNEGDSHPCSKEIGGVPGEVAQLGEMAQHLRAPVLDNLGSIPSIHRTAHNCS